MDFAAWTFAAAAHAETGLAYWRVIDLSLSPFVPALGLALVVTFIGETRERARLVIAAFALFGALAAVSASALVSTTTARWLEGPGWPLVYLALFVPTIAVAIALLARHRGVVAPLPGARERRRVDGILLGITLGAALALTELFADLGWSVPRLGHLASLSTALVLVWLGLRHRLFERPTGARALGLVIAVGCLLGMSLLLLIARFETQRGLLFAGLLLVVAFVGMIGRAVLVDLITERAHAERLAYQGRLAAQLAHDLRNPIAAMKGTLDVVREARRRGEALDDHAALIERLEGLVERLHATTDRYVGAARAEASPRDVDADALVEQALAPFPDADAEVQPGTLHVDPELLVPALQNLLRNAYDASTTTNAPVTLRITRRDRWLVVEVEDRGRGMSPRERQLALEGFFTTKAAGTGLGVSFARRVAEAHGGRFLLISEEGVGTRAVLELPIRSAP